MPGLWLYLDKLCSKLLHGISDHYLPASIRRHRCHLFGLKHFLISTILNFRWTNRLKNVELCNGSLFWGDAQYRH